MTLEALTEFRYGGRAYKRGDRFEPHTPSDAQVLVLIRKARQVSAQPGVAAPQRRTREMRAAEAEAPPPPLVAGAGEAGSVSDAVAASEATADRGGILEALRERARALGVEIDGRWGEARLRQEIAAASRARYQRRDMQPEE